MNDPFIAYQGVKQRDRFDQRRATIIRTVVFAAAFFAGAWLAS